MIWAIWCAGWRSPTKTRRNSRSVRGEVITGFRTAVVAALDEAAHYIAAHKRVAARIYIEFAAVKVKKDDLMRMFNDPDTHYSASPQGVMKYAEFLRRIGPIKNKPPTWKDLFFPPVRDKPGS